MEIKAISPYLCMKEKVTYIKFFIVFNWGYPDINIFFVSKGKKNF